MITGKIELGYNSKSRVVMCTFNDIFEGEFIQYDKDEPVPPFCNKKYPFNILSYYHFYFL